MTKSDEQRWEQAVDRLVRLTESGRLDWQAITLPTRPLMARFIGAQFVAEVAGRRVAVYEKAYSIDHGEFGIAMDSQVMIEFIDDHGDSLWVWPVEGFKRSELLDAIRDRKVDGERFLEDLRRSEELLET